VPLVERHRRQTGRSRFAWTGPSGTGKEVDFKQLHGTLSHRAVENPCVVHCGAIPADLFGKRVIRLREKARLLDAEKDKVGLLSLADGGTYFLDEIGVEMPLAMQVKLLSCITRRTFFPVWRTRAQKHIDIRVISATNADFWKKSRGHVSGRLVYRIKGVNIETQSLAERLEDVPVCLQAFSLVYINQARQKNYSLAPKAVQCFRDQRGPGNVRE